MRILVTGSRELSEAKGRGLVQRALRDYQDDPALTVVVGDCPTGADRYARAWGYHMADIVDEHRADWDTHGKAAGPLRNQAMVDSGADVCLAFYKQRAGNRGTADCVRRAKAAGIPVKEFTE